MAGGQTDQDGGVVTAGRDDHRRSALDMDREQRRVARRIGLQDHAADFLGLLGRLGVGVDDDDVARVGTAGDQLPDRLGAAGAETGDDDVVAKGALQLFHPPLVPNSPEDKSISGAGEDQDHEHADRGHDQGVEHPRSIRHRDDVAVAGGSGADHREIDDVGEADMAVEFVPEAVALDPVNGDDHGDQDEQRAEADGDLHAQAEPSLAAQGHVLRVQPPAPQRPRPIVPNLDQPAAPHSIPTAGMPRPQDRCKGPAALALRRPAG